MRPAAFLVLVTLATPALADGKGDGTVEKLRQPKGDDPGGLTLGKTEYVFAKHLADGKHHPDDVDVLRRGYPHFPKDVRKGDEVSLQYKTDSEGRRVIQRLYVNVKKRAKGNVKADPEL